MRRVAAAEPVPTPVPGASVGGVIGWLAQGEPDVPDDADWLSAREAASANGIRFTKRRSEYLLRRWVGKRAVAVATGLPVDPASLARVEIANRPGGAPYVLVDGEPAELGISLSDRAGWAVALVGPTGGRVGCDLELVEPRSDGFVGDFLTADEQAYVAGRADRDAVVNLMWSAKESALKVLGVGLRRDTRSVEVALGPAAASGWGPLEVRTTASVFPGWWRREGVFLLTVAADRALPSPEPLPGSADLRTARPVHSWLAHPLVD